MKDGGSETLRRVIFIIPAPITARYFQITGDGSRRGLISTALSASLTMALINELHPPTCESHNKRHRLLGRENSQPKQEVGVYSLYLRHSPRYCKYCDFLISKLGPGTGKRGVLGEHSLTSIPLFSADLGAGCNLPV